MSWPLILPMEDQIITGFGGFFFLDATAFPTRVCSVYLFGGTLRRLSLRQMSGMESFGAGLGATWSGQKRFMGKRQRWPSPNYFICVGEVTWVGPSNAKRNEKNCPKKQGFRLGFATPARTAAAGLLVFFFLNLLKMLACCCRVLMITCSVLLKWDTHQLRGKKAKESGKKGELSLNGFSKIEWKPNITFSILYL